MSRLIKFVCIISVTFVFLLSFSRPLDPLSSNWYNQYFPNLNGRPVCDIVFVDSLLGFAITGDGTWNYNYILKTTTGGDVWFFSDSLNSDLTRIYFLNSQTGYIGGNLANTSHAYLGKTTNGGVSWNTINSVNFATRVKDMSILNQDTIWLADPNSLDGGLYRTTNGGNSWILQYSSIGYNPDKIYMYDGKFGFYSGVFYSSLFRTTNGGFNWTQITGENGFTKIKFINNLTGWKADGNYIKKTINGGINWVNQPLPHPAIGYLAYGIYSFSMINSDTIWGVGSRYQFPNLSVRGPIYRTTNGGINWDYQIPDTNLISIMGYSFINFFNKNIGWAYSSNRGIHTLNGGDTNFISGIKQINSEIPLNFKLYQNYPNPFNPITKIKFEIPNSLSSPNGLIGDPIVTLKVYDILGKEIQTLVNETLQPGKYEVTFDGRFCPSGTYFYRMQISNISVTNKMLMIK